MSTVLAEPVPLDARCSLGRLRGRGSVEQVWIWVLKRD